MPDDGRGQEGPGLVYVDSEYSGLGSWTTPRCTKYKATIYGGPGNDGIGSIGNDRLIGGPGKDICALRASGSGRPRPRAWRHTLRMGVRNYLVEGVSASGKTSVCRELMQRGYHAINGDRELAYQGDAQTGEPTDTADHEHHIWDVTLVRAIAADSRKRATFFCGGSRNFHQFLDVFDEIFVLGIDIDTLHHRLDRRPTDEWGARPSERDLIVRLHASREDIPAAGVLVDATRPLADVVDEILRRAGEVPRQTMTE